MIAWLIIACEIGFWIFVLAGLIARYVFKQKKLGAFLLIGTPIVDLVLLLATVVDLKNGAEAAAVHGIAAIYIAVSVVYGHHMIKWADKQFAFRFANGEKPVKRKKYGKELAKEERKGWYYHLLAWLIGSALLAAIILFIHDFSRTEALLSILKMWSLVLIIDFLISFSYTIFPKKEKEKSRK